MFRCAVLCFALLNALLSLSVPSRGEVIDLTLQNAINITLENSYQVRQLKLGIERTRHNLAASRAGLKSRVYMNLQMPTMSSAQTFKWNSTLERDELVQDNNRRFQADLSIRQPVILLGYPTNGYLSLNSRVYRYDQWRDSGDTIDYYNRYFISFEQPLFQPNYLKNDIEQSELSLEREELGYLGDIVSMIDRLKRDYDGLFEEVYTYHIISRWVDNLQQAVIIADQLAAIDSTQAFDAMQVRLELANARERLAEQQSNIRIETSRMIQQLRLDPGDSLHIEPELHITPITVDVEEAVQYGYTLRPRLRELYNSRRRSELSLQETKGRGAFRMNLDVTYGLEKKDEDYMMLLDEQNNSYSVALSAYIPIWDWGQHKEQVESASISLMQTDLTIEQTRSDIESQITTAVANLQEYQTRALSMQENAIVAQELTTESIQRFSDGSVSAQDVLRIVERQYDTESNFLDAYLGYRRSLQSLMTNTYYDFEKDMPLIDSFLEQGFNL